jgi:hypothetical protein
MGALAQQRKQGFFLIMVVQRQIELQPASQPGTQSPIDVVWQAVSDMLKRIAHFGLRLMTHGNHVQRISGRASRTGGGRTNGHLATDPLDGKWPNLGAQASPSLDPGQATR